MDVQVTTANLENVILTSYQLLSDITTTYASEFNSFDGNYAWADAVRQSAHNMGSIIEGALAYHGALKTFTLLEYLNSLPITLNPNQANILSVRYAGTDNFLAAANIKSVVSDVSNLSNGVPCVTDPNELGLWFNQNYEPLPSSISNINDLVNVIQSMPQTWLDIQSAIASYSGTQELDVYDLAGYYSTIHQSLANFYNNVTLNSDLPLQTLWNLIVVPWVYEEIFTAQSENQNNQSAIILGYIFRELELLMSELIFQDRLNQVVSVTTAVLAQNQSLLDFASQNLGDFNQWTAIVAANNLQPPYTNLLPEANVASPGDILYLPNPSGANPTSTSYNYYTNFLGADMDFGFPYSNFPAWNGDFKVTSGFDNLNKISARRILTPLGSYIYDPSFGSVAPSMIGNPFSVASITTLLSQVKISLLNDYRIKDVPSMVPIILNSTDLGINMVIEAKSTSNIGNATQLNIVLSPSPV